MIVLALLAIVATLAGPSFSQYLGRQNLKGAVNESFSDLQYARSEAVQRNRPVIFTASAAGYTIVADPAGTNTNIKTVTLASGNSISSGATMVATFEPIRGTATVTAGPMVFANARTPITVRVAVNTMGRPQICSPDGGPTIGYTPCP